MKKGNFLGIIKSNEELLKFYRNTYPGDYVLLKVGKKKPTYLRYEAVATLATDGVGCYWAETGVFDPYESWR